VCGKLLFKGMILEGFVELKCRHCDYTLKVEGVLNRKNFHTIILDDECHILNISDSTVTLLGFSKSELIGHGMEIIETMTKDKCHEILKKVKDSGSIFYKTNYRNSNNVSIPVNTKVIFFIQRGKEYALIIFKPVITDYDIVNKENEGDYGDVTVHLDVLGNIIFAEMTNKAKKELNYSKEDLIQKSIFDFFVKKDKEKYIKSFNDAVIKEKSIRVSNKFLSKDGNEIQIDSYLIPYYDNFGTFCGFESSGWIVK